jgi:hypothetical protein
MWLAEPFPSPSPITVTVPPDTALDNYTMALANYTRDLAIGTAVLAAFTVALAMIGAVALWLQRRQIKHAEEQLRLARAEFEAARKAAQPGVDLDGAGVDPHTSIVGGAVRYVRGTEPAFDVWVWLRDLRGSYTSPNYYTLTASRPDCAFEAIVVPEDMFEQWAFPEMNDMPRLERGELHVGVTFRDTGGNLCRHLWHVSADGRRSRRPLSGGAQG